MEKRNLSLKIVTLLYFLLLLSCTEKKEIKVEEKKFRKVTVAAIQCSSRMGQKEYNFQKISKLVREASEKSAKIIVLPEAALSGYMDPSKDITWTREEPGEGEMKVQDVAESVNGEFVKKYLKLADDLNIFLTVPFIEQNDNKFFNTVLLVSPEGKILIHHRKKALWTQGDGSWCSEGDIDPKVVETEYGRLGVMICYDVHYMPEKLKKLKADIVLYSVGWYGPNTEDWYKRRFPEKYVVPNNFSVVAANWSHEQDSQGWIGCGSSNIVYKNGIVIKITEKTAGDTIVTAQLPLD